MRGTHSAIFVNIFDNRITPAHAGNTHIRFLNRKHPRDHPRPCGEHVIASVLLIIVSGSPPPMRGTRR